MKRRFFFVRWTNEAGRAAIGDFEHGDAIRADHFGRVREKLLFPVLFGLGAASINRAPQEVMGRKIRVVETENIERHSNGMLRQSGCGIAAVLPGLPGAAGIGRVSKGFNPGIAEPLLLASLVGQESKNWFNHRR